MDEAIRTLKSTTFFGRRLTRRQIVEVQKTVRDFPALSRRELGHTICEHLGWHAPSGTDSIQSALGLLEALEEAGVVTLPRKDETRAPGRQRRPVRTARSEAPSPGISRHCSSDRRSWSTMSRSMCSTVSCKADRRSGRAVPTLGSPAGRSASGNRENRPRPPHPHTEANHAAHEEITAREDRLLK